MTPPSVVGTMMAAPLEFKIGRAQLPAEISGPEVGGRHREQCGAAHALEGALPVGEKEQLVLPYGAADAATINVANAFWLGRDAGAILVPGVGAQGIIGVKARRHCHETG